HELPGQRLFQYLDEDGSTLAIDSEDVNAYIRAVTGEAFSAKDFRTWGATVLAAIELHTLGPADTPAECKRKEIEAVRRVAAALGNTQTVTRAYYIHPAIFAAYENGILFQAMQRAALEVTDDPAGLDIAETAVTWTLQQ
ncbi:MAG TPA: hypothetical protein VFF68_10595, partial [Anaerolineaceae bacterium]|nr:hypothetical protein [Anaerolineaceae bacterium]